MQIAVDVGPGSVIAPRRPVFRQPPIPETELRALAAELGTAGARRAGKFLAAHGMYEKSAPSTDPFERWVRARLTVLPEPVRADVSLWINALRGQGRRPSPTIGWMSVGNYLRFAEPALLEWGSRCDSLRAVTGADIEAAVTGHQGSSAHQVRTALRSLFRGLGLDELRALVQDDHDPVRGTLTVPRNGLPFRITLDDLVTRLLIEWCRTRVQRWPRTDNRHLLITSHTALNEAAISRRGLNRPLPHTRADRTTTPLRPSASASPPPCTTSASPIPAATHPSPPRHDTSVAAAGTGHQARDAYPMPTTPCGTGLR